MKIPITKISLVALLAVVATGCDQKPSTQLNLLHTEEAYVVTGTTSNCTDKRGGTSPVPQSVSADFFALNRFILDWQGKNILVPANISITVTHPYIDDYKCDLSGTLLSDTFGGTSFVGPQEIDMNSASFATTCAVACGNVKRKASSAGISFSTNATIDFQGYSQDANGTNVKPVRSSSHVRLNFF